MTEETLNDESSHDSAEPAADDARFQVKWRKKSESAPRAETAPEEAQQADADELQRELEAERQRSRDLQERWHRAAADLVNLRKRTEQEQAEKEKFASMLLVYELLPVLDNFERALATIPGNLAMLTWIQGVMLVQRQIQAILEHQGLAQIETAKQTFNPALHEAIGERETSDVPPGTIVQEYQRGYTMHGRIIRPSLVEVARAPSEPPQPRPPQEETPAAPPREPEETDDLSGSDVAEESRTENVGP